MDPVDQLKARVARIQPDDAREDVIEAPGPLKPRAGKGGIVGIGGPKQEVHGQSRAATEQGMHAIAARASGGDGVRERGRRRRRDPFCTRPGWERYR